MASNGQSAWLKTEAGQHLQESLANEKVLRGIDHLLSRIETLEQAVDKLSILLEKGPGLLSIAADMTDEEIQKASKRGVDIEQSLGNALHLAEKLTAPDMMEKVDQLLNFADQAPGLVAMTMDMVDEEMSKSNVKELNVKALLEAGSQISTAVSKAEKMPKVKVGGIISMLRTMRDPDRQKAIGYVMNIAKALGQGLK